MDDLGEYSPEELARVFDEGFNQGKLSGYSKGYEAGFAAAKKLFGGLRIVPTTEDSDLDR